MINKKRRPKCSACGDNGHNIRHCPILLMEEKIEKVAQKNQSIRVSVLSSQKESPHVVDLKKNLQKDIWQGVEVWQEAPVKGTERRVVDFAGLVRKEMYDVEQRTKIEDRRSKITVNDGESKEKNKKVSNLRSRSRLRLPVFDFRNKFNEKIRDFIDGFRIKKFVPVTVALLIAVIVPVPAIGYFNQVKEDSRQIVAESANAFLSLQSSTVAALDSNITQAQFDLNSALESFSRADSILEQEHRALVYVVSALPIVGEQISSRQNLLTAGHHLALGNTYLLKGIDAAKNIDTSNTDRLSVMRIHIKSAIPQYKQALADLVKVDESAVPPEYQKSLAEFKILYATFVNDMEDFVGLVDAFNLVMGSDGLKRYLLVFQNNHELRPTGGFMGSFAEIDIEKGRVLKTTVPGGGTYDLKGQLDQYVKPPLPLQVVNKRWEFQDANWFPDFPATAQKIEWFYEHGRQVSVDGVIAINATVLERLLSVIGPVEADNQIILDQENVLNSLQKEVEVNYDRVENKPKAIIGELVQKIFDRFSKMEAVDLVRLLTELNESFKQKEIQVYFNDNKVEMAFQKFGWTGEIVPTLPEQDYLMVVNANVRGEKSDAKVEQELEHQVVVQDDGSIIDTVFIRRRHTGLPNEQFYGGVNLNYVRVYVPAGAELIEADGFMFPPEESFKVPEEYYKDDLDLKKNEVEIGMDAKSGTRITSEFGKTVFGNWLAVSPGETVDVYFTYKLPFNLFAESENKSVSNLARWEKIFIPPNQATSRYSLLVQKQSGSESQFLTRIIYPSIWSPSWRSEDEINLATNGAEWKGELNQDRTFGIAMERN